MVYIVRDNNFHWKQPECPNDSSVTYVDFKNVIDKTNTILCLNKLELCVQCCIEYGQTKLFSICTNFIVGVQINSLMQFQSHITETDQTSKPRISNDISPYKDERISHKPENIYTADQFLYTEYIYIKEASPVFARHPDVRAMITIVHTLSSSSPISSWQLFTVYSPP